MKESLLGFRPEMLCLKGDGGIVLALNWTLSRDEAVVADVLVHMGQLVFRIAGRKRAVLQGLSTDWLRSLLSQQEIGVVDMDGSGNLGSKIVAVVPVVNGG